MKRQRAKFPWDLYWKNKTYKLKRCIKRCWHITKHFHVILCCLNAYWDNSQSCKISCSQYFKKYLQTYQKYFEFRSKFKVTAPAEILPRRRNLSEVLHLEVTAQERTGRARQTREGRGSLLIMFPHFFGGKSANHKWCDASYKIETLLQKAELGSTLRNMLPQLATSKFVAGKLGAKVAIRATTLFNLQCNNVALQVERKCCPYFLNPRASKMKQVLHSDWLPDSPASNFPRWFRFSPYNISFVYQAWSVKMDECWPRIFSTSSPGRFSWGRSWFSLCVSIDRDKENLANIQPSWHHVWSITHIH